MSYDLNIRPAQPSELNEVSKLFSEILESLPYYNSLAKSSELKKYTPLKLKDKISQDPYSVIVALNGSGKVKGFCFNHFDDFTIWIDWFGVEPSSRKKGVGMAILKTVFETATKRGAHKVWCDTRSSNEPSKNLLKKAGFREIVEIKNHWYKQDFILWERFL
jgi:ribosomal protein S18 acetylase RimI-like enzyme